MQTFCFISDSCYFIVYW